MLGTGMLSKRQTSGTENQYNVVGTYQIEILITMRTTLLALSFPDNSREDGSKKGIPHFDKDALNLIGHHNHIKE